MSRTLVGRKAKLGLLNEEKEDESLIENQLTIMHNHAVDYTNTFRALTFETREDAMFKSPEFALWQEQRQVRLGGQDQSKVDSHQLMRSSNPGVISRNHRAEEAL